MHLGNARIEFIQTPFSRTSESQELPTAQHESPRGNDGELCSPSEFTMEPFPEHPVGLGFFRGALRKSSFAGIIQRNLHLVLESVASVFIQVRQGP